MRPKPGQRVWKMGKDLKVIQLTQADFQYEKGRKALFMNPAFMYCVALNEPNAARKFLKLLKPRK